MNTNLILAQIERIESAVQQFGSALDAMDHGADVAAEQLEREGHESIRAAFESAPELRELLPQLWSEIEQGHDVADQGYDILRETKNARDVLGKAG